MAKPWEPPPLDWRKFRVRPVRRLIEVERDLPVKRICIVPTWDDALWRLSQRRLWLVSADGRLSIYDHAD